MSLEVWLVVYMLAAVVGTGLVCRFAPVLQPPRFMTPLVGLFILGLWLTFGAAGAFIPIAIRDGLMDVGSPWLRSHPPDLGVLGRIAQVVGGLCGLVMGIRGTALWATLFLFGLAATALVTGCNWVLTGH